MTKEKVFIVLSHKHSLKDTRSKTKGPDDWQVTETVEFVNQIRNKHINSSSAIGDYINRKMISGSTNGIADYDRFEYYIREKYPKEMAELDAAYKDQQVLQVDNAVNMFSDQFGNTRPKTVFDV